MDNERYAFLGERIDHEGGRIDDLDMRVTALEGGEETKQSRKLEWVVIVLIVVEIIEALAIAYLELRHA